jgi:hypothetical protein
MVAGGSEQPQKRCPARNGKLFSVAWFCPILRVLQPLGNVFADCLRASMRGTAMYLGFIWIPVGMQVMSITLLCFYRLTEAELRDG